MPNRSDPNIKKFLHVNRRLREILSIDVSYFNFKYKYYNPQANDCRDGIVADLLRHLCNSTENVAENQKVRPGLKLTALSCDVTRLNNSGLVSLTCLR